MSVPWQENVDSDQFHRDIEWDLGRTDYEPATGAYVAPWDRQGWGSNDVVLTPPRSPGGYVPPSRPAIQEGQRDYVYMPTEKEQWRIGDENKRRQAAAVGKDWRESRLPRSVPEEPKEKVYEDWRESKLPEKRDPRAPIGTKPWHFQKEDRREWGESRPDEAYIQIEGPGNPSWERRNPRRSSLRDTLIGAMKRSWR